MDAWVDLFLHGNQGLGTVSIQTALLMLLLAFCIGQLIGWVYMWTHTGLSYSQMFASSLVVLPPLVAVVMMLVAGNLLLAIGLLAVFAMVRFRNVLKDTRDTVFILWSIVQGMAVGTASFSTAVVTALLISAIFLYLRMTSFGGRHRYDVVLHLNWGGDPSGLSELRPLLRRFSVRAQLAGQRPLGDDGLDVSYRLLLRDPSRSRELITSLESVEQVRQVSLFHRQDESEI